MYIAITGAAGFIGKTVCRHLLEKGHSVSALVRKSTDITFYHKNLTWFLGDIKDTNLLEQCFKHADYVVHLAAVKNDELDSYQVNVQGTKNVTNACIACSVRGIVYFSTISTKFVHKGIYANTKHQADELLKDLTLPTVILKPSVVYGNLKVGILGTLIKFTKLPIVPIVGSGTFTMRPIHVNDVATAVEHVIVKGIQNGCVTFDLGGPQKITFNDLAKQISKIIHNKPLHAIHIPISIGLFIARLFSIVLKHPPITPSNIIAMNQDAEVDYMPFYKTYNLNPIPFTEGLAFVAQMIKKPKNETYYLLQYILPSATIDEYMVDLYARALEKYKLDTVSIHKIILSHPWLIGALDAVTKIFYPHGTLQKKLFIAATIVECSPLSSTWLLPKQHTRSELFLEITKLIFLSLLKIPVGALLISITSIRKNNV